MALVGKGIDRFLADCGVTLAPDLVADNRLFQRAKARLAVYGGNRTIWDSNADLIAELVGVVSTDQVITLTDKGLPIAQNDHAAFVVTSPYGWRLKPGPGHHHGIDIAPKAGDAALDHPLVASFDGKIVQRTWVPGYGRTLTIQANETWQGQPLFLFYAHMESYAPGIEVNRPVKQGQIVGGMGKSGSDRYPVHLHYEARVGRNDKTATWNPLKIFAAIAQNLAVQKGSVTQFDNYAQLAAAHPSSEGKNSGDNSA